MRNGLTEASLLGRSVELRTPKNFIVYCKCLDITKIKNLAILGCSAAL